MNSWVPAEDAADVESVLNAGAHIIAANNFSEEQCRSAAEHTVKKPLSWYEERIKWDKSPLPVE